MLHTDAGEAGTYEFPGADVPVQAGGQVVVMAFAVASAAGAEQPAALPQTGGPSVPWMPILLVSVGIVVLMSGAFALRHLRTREARVDRRERS
jgi:hypothetical protein